MGKPLRSTLTALNTGTAKERSRRQTSRERQREATLAREAERRKRDRRSELKKKIRKPKESAKAIFFAAGSALTSSEPEEKKSTQRSGAHANYVETG